MKFNGQMRNYFYFYFFIKEKLCGGFNFSIDSVNKIKN